MKTAKPPASQVKLRLPEDLKTLLQDYAESVGISVNTAVVLAVRNFLPFAIKEAKNLRMAPPPTAVFARPAPAARPTNNAPKYPKVGRNDLCPCGSGKKAKFCHQA